MQRSKTPEGQPTRDRYAAADRTRARMESRALPLALGVVLLVFLVALGSSRSLAHIGGPGDLTREQLVVSDLIALSIAAAAVPAMLLVLWQILHQIREEDELLASARATREKQVLKLVLVLALVTGVITAFALTRHQIRSNPAGQRPASSRPSTTSTLPDREKSSQKTVTALAPWVVGGVDATIVLLLAGVWVARRRRRANLPHRTLLEDELESPRRELHELVENSIEEIERERDPRRAVIRAYAGMESTLAKHDLGRRPFEAPGEYLSRAFAAMRLSRRPAERLTELFERARFSQHAIGPEMKRESIAALAELRNELEAKPR